jgi:UDP-N-acetylmuramate dehydrogenase
MPIGRLPAVRGRLDANAPLGRHTWFGVGGPAELLFQPADRDDLAAFLAALPAAVPLTAIGGGANLLIRDGGVPGVVIRLGRGFADVAAEGGAITAGAAALHLNVARFAAEAGLGGLEFLSGIPGTIGGGLRMNAGAYGREVKDIAVSAVAIDRAGRKHLLTAAKMGFSYRRCAVDREWVFVEALLGSEPGDRTAVSRRMTEIRAAREATQPIRARTGGSTFRNPPGDSAWRLIDAAGCRGLRRGGAMVSPKHTNFLVNTGAATAADLEGLGEEVRRRVFNTSGVVLEWEIRRIGRPRAAAAPLAEEVRWP